VITLLKEDLYALAVALAVIILATGTFAGVLTYLLLARTVLRRAWDREAEAQADASLARLEVEKLRFAIGDALRRLHGLGTSGSCLYAARLLDDTVGQMLGDAHPFTTGRAGRA